MSFRLRSLLGGVFLLSLLFATFQQLGVICGLLVACLLAVVVSIVGMRTERAGKRNAYYGCAVTILVAAVLAFAINVHMVMDRHGIPVDTMKQLSLGMTMEEVRNIAGTPNYVRLHQSGRKTWMYDRNTFCQVRVHFSDLGEVDEIIHDH